MLEKMIDRVIDNGWDLVGIVMAVVLAPIFAVFNVVVIMSDIFCPGNKFYVEIADLYNDILTGFISRKKRE